MRQGTSSSDITNKRNCRTIFADYVRQRQAAQLGLRSPVNIQAFTNPALAYQTAVEGAAYTTSDEYDSYIAEVSRPEPISVATVPGAPTGVTGTPGNSQVTVSFIVPTDNGGSAITSYSVTASPGGITETGSSSPITVSGLTNGTTYTFSVVATNAIGNSPQSLASLGIIPSTVPAAPDLFAATPGNGQAIIGFNQPSNGGSVITNYQYSINNGVSYTAFSPAQTSSPVTITGLTNGITYQVRLKAVNANGVSAQSLLAISVTPNTTPATPTIQYLLAGDRTAYIYVSAGSGGGTATNYQYTMDSGATYISVSPAAITSPITVTGLTNGSSTTFGVRAVNDVGNSAVSNYVSVTPVNPSTATPLLYYDPSNVASYSGTGATVTSIGSGTATGTKAAAVTYNAAVKGGVFDFPGTNGAVISFGSYNFGNTISVTAWIYPRSQANINGLFTNAGANVPTNGFKFQWNFWLTSSRAISFQAGNGSVGNDDFTPNDTLTYNTWQHVGYVFDKVNQKIIFFLNGQPTLVATDVTTVANINTNAAFNIGGYIGGSYTMNAQLGYIKIFNTLLDATQIEADYSNSAGRFA